VKNFFTKRSVQTRQRAAGFVNAKYHRLAVGIALAVIGSVNTYGASSYTATDLTAVSTTSGFSPQRLSGKGTILGQQGQIPLTVPLLYDIASNAVTNIQTLSTGDLLTAAADINNSGQVVGKVILPGSTPLNPQMNIVVRNVDGTVYNLGGFTGAKFYSVLAAAAISDTGGIIGNSTAGIQCDNRAFSGSINSLSLQQINSLVGPFGWINAFDINSLGQVVGQSSADGNCFPGSPYHAFVSVGASIKDLHDPQWATTTNGYGYSLANAINDKGFAVGRYAFLFGPGSRNYPYGMPGFHAVVWDTATGVATDVGKAGASSELKDINLAGDVVGIEATAILGTYGVVGTVAGGLTNLNNVVSGLPAGWQIIDAFDINDSGQILATATDAARVWHNLLLTPGSVALPMAPGSLTAVAISSSQISLGWIDKNTGNETAQYVERCQGAGCTNFTQIASVAPGATSFVDTGLTAATPYSYRLRAHGPAGDSAYSNAASATTASVVTPTPTPLPSLPAAPSGLTNPSLSRSRVELGWVDNSNNESWFYVERCRGLNCSSFNRIAVLRANTTSYFDTNISRNTSYNYRVQAVNSAGKSDFSNMITVNTLP
jgi:probable HAF family extracellular repeat protein